MVRLYYHNGSYNHGCEAIVRATQKILGKNDIILYSRKPESDRNYGLQEIVQVCSDQQEQIASISLERVILAIYRRLVGNNALHTYITHKNFFKNIQKDDVYFSIGGDNYCYAGKEVLGHYNDKLHKRGAKTVLWGCSFEANEFSEELRKDISQYDLIVARESISYELLKKYNQNTFLIPDPAFQLPRIDVPCPDGFFEGKTVGINVSPLIVACEHQSGITMKNYIRLIEWILNETDMNIALIPHVVEKNNDDRTVLCKLMEYFSGNNRIYMVSDCSCTELKGYIARCRFFVGARTHATIAAYSTQVPTLVVGYSVKATGIAKDLFGTDHHYVIPVQHLKEEIQLLNEFQWLMRHEQEVRNHLKKIMPEYCERVLEVRNILERTGIISL